jgi:sulfofructose kinase
MMAASHHARNLMPPKLICVGNTTLDRVWLIDRLPSGGGKFPAHDYLELGGGMAANAAVAVARLGGACAYWGRAGDDSAGKVMLAEMAAYGVDVSQFRLIPDARSSVSGIMVSGDGERMIVNFRGEGLDADPAWLPLQQIAGCAALHGDVRWPEAAAPCFATARAHRIPTVLDGEIASAEVFGALLPLVDHAIFSEPGLRAFAGGATDSDEARLSALRQARRLGCRVAAVTRGREGVVWIDADGVHRQPAFVVDVVDTTGAGDVFHGAYALAIAEGGTVDAAMRFASAVSALKCTGKGGRAAIPTRERTLQFISEREGAGPTPAP